MVIKELQILITGLMFGYAFTQDLQTDSSDSRITQYYVDTCSPLNDIQTHRHTLPVKLIQQLKLKLKCSRNRLQTELSSIKRNMSGRQEQCDVISYFLPSIYSSSTMDELLVSSLEAVSATYLNLTIVNQHNKSPLQGRDIDREPAAILCHLRQLLYRIPFDRSICHPQLTLSSQLSVTNLLAFTCKNLSRAISLYSAIESRLVHVLRNEMDVIC